jgi:hypothetical protein
VIHSFFPCLKSSCTPGKYTSKFDDFRRIADLGGILVDQGSIDQNAPCCFFTAKAGADQIS